MERQWHHFEMTQYTDYGGVPVQQKHQMKGFWKFMTFIKLVKNTVISEKCDKIDQSNIQGLTSHILYSDFHATDLAPIVNWALYDFSFQLKNSKDFP